MSDARCISILAHPLRPQSFPIAESIRQSIDAHGIEACLYTEWIAEDVEADVSRSELVVAIGGDGAMLRAARVCAPYSVPVLGINMGQLGFLTEIANPDDWSQRLDAVLGHDYWVEKRMMLHVTIRRQGEIIISGHALNDVVISGDMFGRMIQLSTFIDGDWTTTYHADALVLATATGSTAYALACGGPILPPELKNILIVPAAPHLSMGRPIVLSEGSHVDVLPSPHSKSPVVVNADGVQLCEMEADDSVHVQASDYVTRFVRMRGRNYFYRALLDRLEPRIRRDGDREPMAFDERGT